MDQRSDLWSLGVIAYRCIVGSLPFEGEAIGDLLVKLCTAPIPVPSQVAPDVPQGFDAWLHKALTREPEQRFQSAAELQPEIVVQCSRVMPLDDEGKLTLFLPDGAGRLRCRREITLPLVAGKGGTGFD